MNVIADRDYEFICRQVYERSRIHLGANKKEMVSARLSRRLHQLGLEDCHAYCRLLKSEDGKEELAHLVDLIATNYTNFFRETEHFKFLIQTVVRDWKTERRLKGGECFRVWSSAASTGEEAYSIAILLAEAFADELSVRWKVEASDISSRVIEKARLAVYSGERMQLVREERVRRHFQYGVGNWEGFYRVRPELRAQVHFHELNLLQDRYPFERGFHVIFCRNVMIYFDHDTQEQLVTRLSEQLLPGGYLFVGHSETLTGIRHPLKVVLPSIYRKPLSP